MGLMSHYKAFQEAKERTRKLRLEIDAKPGYIGINEILHLSKAICEEAEAFRDLMIAGDVPIGVRYSELGFSWERRA